MGNLKKTDRIPTLELNDISSVDEFVANLRAEASAMGSELGKEVSATELEPLLRRWAEVDNAYDQMVLVACSAEPDLAQVATLERLRRDLAKIVIRFTLNSASEKHQAAQLLLLKELLPGTLKLQSLSSWQKSYKVKALSTEELRNRLQQIASDLRDRPKLQIQDLSPHLLRLEEKLSSNSLEESDMSRDSSERERDEYGRFVSDGDRGGRRSYSGRDDQRRSNSRDDDDDRRRARSRDDDDDRRRSSSRDDDDDRRRSRDDDDRRGWYGDSEGHAEAARRGWEDRDRGSSRSMPSDYRDDDRRYGRRDDDDDRRYGRSSRDDDRGQGGWFGDPEGHSEASRRGWENREGSTRRSSSRYEDDDRRSSNRGRDDEGRFTSGGGRGSRDDDDRSSNYRARDEEGRFTSSSRGRGRNDDDDRRRSRSDYDDDNRGRRDNPGWSGDPEGHAEAARKGWEHRR